MYSQKDINTHCTHIFQVSYISSFLKTFLGGGGEFLRAPPMTANEHQLNRQKTVLILLLLTVISRRRRMCHKREEWTSSHHQAPPPHRSAVEFSSATFLSLYNTIYYVDLVQYIYNYKIMYGNIIRMRIVIRYCYSNHYGGDMVLNNNK